MKLEDQVRRGIYKVGKLVGTAGKVLKSRVHLLVPRSTSAYYSFSKIHPMVPKRTSVYYLQTTVPKYAWWSPGICVHGPMCTICRGCLVLLSVCPVRKSKFPKMPFQLSLMTQNPN
jgi:hypothetical protein